MDASNPLEIDGRHPSIVLFDGVCNLCAGCVRFIIPRDPKGRFVFAALQSEAGRKALRAKGLPGGMMKTLVLIEDGQAFFRSDAVLQIARHLSGLWPLLTLFYLLPRAARDGIYAFTARHRRQWFGRRATCLLATPDHPERFLPEPEDAPSSRKDDHVA